MAAPEAAERAGAAAVAAVPGARSLAGMAIPQAVADRFDPPPLALQVTHKFLRAQAGLFSFHTSPSSVKNFSVIRGLQMHRKVSPTLRNRQIGRMKSLWSFKSNREKTGSSASFTHTSAPQSAPRAWRAAPGHTRP